jgi:hypothetical protein
MALVEINIGIQGHWRGRHFGSGICMEPPFSGSINMGTNDRSHFLYFGLVSHHPTPV